MQSMSANLDNGNIVIIVTNTAAVVGSVQSGMGIAITSVIFRRPVIHGGIPDNSGAGYGASSVGAVRGGLHIIWPWWGFFSVQ